LTRRSEARKKLHPYKSKFEQDFHAAYPQLGYEKDKIKYLVEHTYNPDWKVKENVYIETKGAWLPKDRAKHLYIREQHPEVTVYLVFQNPNNKLSRVSKTTYGEYCDKHGIEWATIDTIPREWFK
jgi:Phage endonuclease I